MRRRFLRGKKAAAPEAFGAAAEPAFIANFLILPPEF
jgi:hypothetical protein